MNAQILNFNFSPDDAAENSFNKSSLVFTLINDGAEYNLLVTSSSTANSSPGSYRVAKQFNFGLGVKEPLQGQGSWAINTGENIHFALTDAANNPVDFSIVSLKAANSNNLFVNERATLTINSNAYLFRGGAPNTIITDQNIIDSSHTWSGERADNFNLTPEIEGGVSSQFRLLELSIRLDEAGPQPPSPLQNYTIDQQVNSETIERSFSVRLPSTVTKTSYPVVFFFHGSGGQGSNFLRSDILQMIDDEEFVGVFPNGYNNKWNVNNESPADDVAFFKMMLTAIAVDTLLDLNQVYGIGTSNGAGMINKLGKETNHFRGIAPIVSQQLTYIGAIQPPRPLSVFQVNGQDDTTIPPAGGSNFAGDFLSAEASVANWAGYFNCSTGPVSTTLTWGARTVQETTYSDCQENRDVRLHIVEGVGHQINLQGASLYQIIWSFLKDQHAGLSVKNETTNVPAMGGLGIVLTALPLLGVGVMRLKSG
tara:strand:- start:8841 stop:10283 length:1443 start_codon:yes stop_codon:yes gene_type:complete